MYKLISSTRGNDVLSIGFHRSIGALEKELTNKKTTKGNYHVRINLKGIFSFAEHQGNCSYGLGYKFTLQRNSHNHVLSRLAGANDAVNFALAERVNVEDLSWYVPHYTISNISNQKLLLWHIVSETATELSCIKRSS